MKKYFIYIILSFGLSLLKAQNTARIDSLMKAADKESSDTGKVNNYLRIYFLTKNTNPLIAKEYIIKSNSILSSHLATHPKTYFNTLIECSYINRSLGNYTDALPYINRAFVIADSLNNSLLAATAYGEKGLLLMNVGDFAKAQECILKEISIRTIANASDTIVFGGYNNLAIIYAQTGQMQKAEEHFRLALQTAIKLGHAQGMGNGYNNLGVIKIMQGKLDSVMYYLEKGKVMRMKANDITNLSGSYNNYALYYKELKKYDLALRYADTAYQLANKVHAQNALSEVLDTYYHLYEERGDYKKALDYYRQRREILEEVQNKKIDRKISEYQGSLELQKKQEELNESKSQLLLKEEKESKQKMKMNLMILVLLSFGVGIFLVVNRNKKISAANKIISSQKEVIEEKHKDITDSINYAQKIQTALIISEKALSAKVDNVFVLFKPRDIVSGDFYWYGEKNGYKLLAVADCTGHGVPGAFMSMIGITMLNQIVNEKGITSPAEILNKLREGVIASLNQTNEEAGKRDGMDVSLIAWNKQELIYAGANNPCVIISNNEILELKPNKQPVGLYEKQEPFTEQKVDLKIIESIYLFTDGVVDQFGGPENKKVKIKLYKEWLNEIAKFDSAKQKAELELKFSNWKKSTEQTDDVLVIGIKA
ncbi:MAG: tetratricopeptide repeat protein [Bacteroidia bacterium]|nr:tetratricopeptide repeat protein [Bacteroidia bacterium]